MANVLAVLMALFSPYPSFSQGSTSPEMDWALSGYLFALFGFFIILAVASKDSDKRIEVRWVKVRFWQICLFIAAMAMFVRMVNVVDYSLADPENTERVKVVGHFLFTGLLVAAAAFLVWHFYPRQTSGRILTTLVVTAGGLAFVVGFFSDLYSVGLGEMWKTIAISVGMWPIVNEIL